MINITKLNNGVRVVNEYMNDVESVSAHIWVKTGSRNETKKINGISHFIEHMAFKGTTTRNTKQIAEEFDNIGGQSNAFTSLSVTAYYTKVLKEYIEKGVELLADIFQNSIYLESEIEKERKVILQELAMGKDDPTDLIDEYFQKTCYSNQSYGRPIIGTKNNINNFTRNDLIDYVNNQYKTEDIIISFAGKLKNEDAIKLVNKYFTKLNIGKNKNPKKVKWTGGYFAKNKKLEQAQIFLGFESLSLFDKRFYEMGILSIILGGGISSKLFQEIRERRGLCYNVYASNSSNDYTGCFEVYSAVSPEKINETIIAIIEEIKKSITNITQEEFNRAIALLKSNLLMNRESNSSRAKKNASNLLIENRIISTEEIIEELNKITIKKIQLLLEEILTKSTPSVAILGKLDKNLIDFENIKKLINK